MKEFDIVIPVGPNDISVIEDQIKYTRANVIGYRHIYLVSYDPSIQFDGCITIDENIFPFNLNTVAEKHSPQKRNGWYLQQLLKLYAGLVIPDIMTKYLVIDSDTFFLKPTTFVENGRCLYNYGTEIHPPYFQHMERLHPSFKKMVEQSGICHHMMFETKYVKELIELVETMHHDLFYNVFIKLATEINGSGASEYEIYFNYILKNHGDQVMIRQLEWTDVKVFNITINTDCSVVPYVYLSYHWHMRE